MDVISVILAAAKSIGVNGALLLAICSHESRDFKVGYTQNDHGSPSYGLCQVKEVAALQSGFKGDPRWLNDPKTNAKYAALYLRYQRKQYGNNWVKLVSSYNAGHFIPSKTNSRCPQNMDYVRLVQKKLPFELQGMLDCGGKK